MNNNTLTKHQEAIELALCQRDYELMDTYRPEILKRVERAVDEGVEPEVIKRWALKVVVERELVQRIYNSARYMAHLKA